MQLEFVWPMPVETTFDRTISPAFSLSEWLSAGFGTLFGARSMKSARMGERMFGQFLGCGVIAGSVNWLLFALHSSFSGCVFCSVVRDCGLPEAIGYVGQSGMDEGHYLRKRKSFKRLRIGGSQESYGCESQGMIEGREISKDLRAAWGLEENLIICTKEKVKAPGRRLWGGWIEKVDAESKGKEHGSEDGAGGLRSYEEGGQAFEGGIFEILRLCGGSRSTRRSKVNSAASHSSDCRIEIASHVKVINADDFEGNEEVIEFVFASDSHLREIGGFRKCTSLCRIELPSSVEVIASSAFNGCTSLSELMFALDSHLREIGGFRWCTSLCRIELPSSVEVLASSAFDECISLRELMFASDSHLREIGGFGWCTSLCWIELPSSVEVIASSAFLGCRSLIELIFGSGSHLREIGGLQRCTSLCRLELPSSVEVITSSAFLGCRSLNELMFASDSHLHEIGGFQRCRSLSRIELPSSVEVLASSAFCECTLIRVVTFLKGSPLAAARLCKSWRAFVLFQAEREQVKGKRKVVHLLRSGTSSGFRDYEF
jgi:hypothetical protein